MAEKNGHEGISHPFGEKHGVATKGKRDLADRMSPNFHDQLARGSAAYATQLWTARHKEAVEAVKADLRELTLSHDEKHHAGWKPYVPEPNALVPYCSVGARQINLGIPVPVLDWGKNRHTEHQQLICSDGENFGLSRFGDKDSIVVEEIIGLPTYNMSPVKYHKSLVVESRNIVDKEWAVTGKEDRYSYANNNCQHYIEKILNKATAVAKERNIKLIID